MIGFIIGVFVGVILGVVIMALLSFHKLTEYIDLKDYEITKGDCAVGNNPDTVIEVGTLGFWVNQLSERNEDYLVPDDCDFISWDEIGKSYFLTKEAAEQALKEREA